MTNTLRIAQYGTKHGHAAGKLLALQQHPAVELVGVFEPDLVRRTELDSAAGPFSHIHWFDSAEELLHDPAIVAVAVEGDNHESLAQAEQCVRAGKHIWYDKPAGTHWNDWQRVVALARERNLLLQMGYMFRYHAGFQQLANWVHIGLLGQLYAVRAHMSTWLPEAERRVIARHPAGICYDLAGHMLDQIVWLLGRPTQVSAFLRHDGGLVPELADNTLVVCGYAGALATVDIAAIEAPPPARRFEVYGARGSAILEPFEPAGALRLCLLEASGPYVCGEQFVSVALQSRQTLYNNELAAFVAAILGQHPPDRSLDHELLVQETLLRATGDLPVA